MRNLLFGLGVMTVVGGMVVACGGDDPAAPIGETPRAGNGGKGGKGSGGNSGSANVGGGEAGEASGGKGGSRNTSEGGAGGGGEGGAAGHGGAAEGGAAGADAGGGPTVLITAPLEVTDPNAAAVLVGTQVAVTCLATPGEEGSPVNASSAEISLLDDEGAVITKKAGTLTANPNEFTNTFELAGVAGGKVGFACVVSDQAKGRGRDAISTLLDKGPTIDIVAPEVDSAHALATPLNVVFNVLPALLGEGDLGAAVDTVTLTMGGKNIPVAGKDDGQGKYQLQVNLADPVLFTPSPSGSFPIVVKAKNKRAPTAAEATASENIVIDGVGPTIAITSPADADVVGTKVTLKFTVKDAVAGIDPASVAVSLNNTEYKYVEGHADWAGSNVATGTFSFQFDARQFSSTKVQITVNITAKDLVGNLSASGPTASRLLYLDNFAPLIDLDPSNIRVVNAQNECSISFDPAGPLARNDLDQVEAGGVFRAFVWEQTNSSPDIPFQHYSMTNQGSVRLYFEPASTPLLIDKDGDAKDICDDVAQVASTRSLGLEVVPKGGQTWFAKGDEATAPTAGSLACTTKTGSAPAKMCTGNKSDMWQVLERPVLKEPTLYSASVTSSTAECTGQGWEFGSLVTQDGWYCFAARVVDVAGNVGISPPLRICLDSPDIAGTPACANSSVNPPSCTDGCTPPARVSLGKVDL